MVNINNTQSSFSGGIISTELFSRLDFSKVLTGLKQCDNFAVRPAGGVVYRAGTKYVAGAKYNDKNVALIPFVYNKNDGVCLEVGHQYIRFHKDGDPVKDSNGNIIEIATTYLSDEVSDIKYAQDKNTIYLVHQNHCPAMLKRISDTSWVLTDMVFNPPVVKVPSVTIAKGTAKNASAVVDFDKWQYAVSVVDNDDNEGLPVYSNIISSDVDLANQNITVTFNNPEDSSNVKKFNVYRIKGGVFLWVYVLDYVSGTSPYSLKDIGLGADASKSVKEEFADFNNGNYPGANGIWNQRMLFAKLKNDPNKFLGSCVGAFQDFTNTYLNGANEALSLTLNSGTNDTITDVVPLDDLMLLTESKAWRVTGMTPNNIKAYIESYSGSSGINPAVSQKSILYVDSSKNTIRNFIYSYELNGYSGQNLDILSRDLFDGYNINNVTLKNAPYSVFYCTRNDGTLLGLTYLKEENIYAWHSHTTSGGKFECVCSIEKNMNDQVYCVVNRNGNKYIEMFKDNINISETIDDSWHLDCATRFIADSREWKNTSSETVSTTYLAYTGVTTTDTYYAWRSKLNIIGGEMWSDYYFYSKNINENDVNNRYATPSFSATTNKNDLSKLSSTTALPGGPRTVGYESYPSSNFTSTSTPEISNVYIVNAIIGAPVYKKEGDDFIQIGVIESISGTSLTFNGFSYSRFTTNDEVVSKTTSVDGYLYTFGEVEAGDLAYADIEKTSSYSITAVGNNTITANGKLYNFHSENIGSIETVSGLSRFNDKTVTALIDGNVYNNISVSNGDAVLPVAGKNVLIGLSYRGIIETIPQEIKYGSGSSSVGANRKIFDGVLSYQKTRGLKYGKDVDNLFEIKPYTNVTFGEKIPLESGNIVLRVSSGFNNETSFVVVQDNPLPALIQSVTLGTSYNGTT